MSALEVASARLDGIDQRLAREVETRLTLDPERARPTPLSELARRLWSPADDDAAGEAWARALEAFALSTLKHFPHNLFWDFDHVGACLARVARREGREALERQLESLLALQALFGQHAPIRFRYVHDFVYGFDWQRFVARDPARRASIGPFDRPFLEHVRERGRAITAAIARGDDAEYPPLPAGRWRNPFGFSRLPEHELRLHRDLACRGLIPVQGWRIDARCDYGRPYTQLRLERARALGIPGDYAIA